MDSFVAMGGHSDKSGVVTRKTILDTLLNTFALTFDVSNFLDSIGISDEALNFN